MPIKSQSNNKIYLSIDFEDCSYDFKRSMGLNKDNVIREKALWQSYHIINNFLESKLNGERITFFCTGILATKCPELVKKISNDGHEIACHYYFHDSISKETLEEFESNIILAINELEKCSNNKVVGFRAPNFSINSSDVEHYKIISKYFKYDSSLSLNNQSVITQLKRFLPSDNLNILPVIAEKPYKGFPYMKSGGSYLKLFHIHFSLQVISKNLLNNHIAHVYLHPYEFVSDLSFYTSWKEMNGLSFFRKIYWTLRQSQWHIVGNKTVIQKLEKIFMNYENGGKLMDIT
jgi:hypothetical protein